MHKFTSVVVCTRIDTGDSYLLNQVVMPILSEDEWSPSEGKLYAGPMVGMKSICFGDSGGPLVCKKGDRWYQHGINSFVFSCTAPGYPSGFADVAYFVPWIERQTGGK